MLNPTENPRRTDLNAAIAAYKASGGRIVRLAVAREPAFVRRRRQLARLAALAEAARLALASEGEGEGAT